MINNYEEPDIEVVMKKGEMTKDPFDMTEEEEAIWQKDVQEQAKKYLFSIGQPLVFTKDDKTVIEYSDGRIEVK